MRAIQFILACAFTAAAQPERLQARTFVGDHGAERPAIAQGFNEPNQIVIMVGKDAGVAVQ